MTQAIMQHSMHFHESAMCCSTLKTQHVASHSNAKYLQVVLAPHVYGPAVTHAPKAWAGPELFSRLSSSVGWATRPSAHALVSSVVFASEAASQSLLCAQLHRS